MNSSAFPRQDLADGILATFASAYLRSADGADEYNKDNDDEQTDIGGFDPSIQNSLSKSQTPNNPDKTNDQRKSALLYVANDESDDERNHSSTVASIDSDDDSAEIDSDSDLDEVADNSPSHSRSHSFSSSKPWSMAGLFQDLQSLAQDPQPLPSSAPQTDSSVPHWSSGLLPSDLSTVSASSSSSSSFDSSLLSLLSSWRSLAFRLKQFESSKVSQLTNSLAQNVEQCHIVENEMEKYVQMLQKSKSEEEQTKEPSKNLIIRVSEVKPADAIKARAANATTSSRRKQSAEEEEDDHDAVSESLR